MTMSTLEDPTVIEVAERAFSFDLSGDYENIPAKVHTRLAENPNNIGEHTYAPGNQQDSELMDIQDFLQDLGGFES